MPGGVIVDVRDVSTFESGAPTPDLSVARASDLAESLREDKHHGKKPYRA
jgi:hypothetical protein